MIFTFYNIILQTESRSEEMDLRCLKSCYSEIMLNINFLSLKFVCNQPPPEATGFQKHSNVCILTSFF